MEQGDAGRLVWIGIARAYRGPIEELDEAELLAEVGIQGERHAGPRLHGGRNERQVTLVQAEHLGLLAERTGRAVVALYEAAGPTLAAWIADDERRRAIARALLAPAVTLAEWLDD